MASLIFAILLTVFHGGNVHHYTPNDANGWAVASAHYANTAANRARFDRLASALPECSEEDTAYVASGQACVWHAVRHGNHTGYDYVMITRPDGTAVSVYGSAHGKFRHSGNYSQSVWAWSAVLD